MRLIYSQDYDLIKSVLADIKLLKAAGYEERLLDFEVPREFDWLLIEDEARLVGCFQLRKITNRLVEAHINIRSMYWGQKDLAYDACKRMFNYLITNTKFRVLLTDVPSECKQVQNLLARLGCRVSGLIKDGVVYNGKIQDLLLYTINL